MKRHLAVALLAARSGVLRAALGPLRALQHKATWADAILDHYVIPGGVIYQLVIEQPSV